MTADKVAAAVAAVRQRLPNYELNDMFQPVLREICDLPNMYFVVKLQKLVVSCVIVYLQVIVMRKKLCILVVSFLNTLLNETKKCIKKN